MRKKVERRLTGSRCVPALLVAAATLLGSVRAADQATPTVLAVYPHDTAAFTQGLLLHGPFFYESTGLYGQSSLRRVDPLTGTVLLQHDLATDEFGEGLARVGDRLIQLTWNENTAHVHDVADFAPLDNFHYAGEGWGLCHDGQRLIMSDGSSELTFRDPDTFALLGQVEVTLDGAPVVRLNELECVGHLVYANVWLTDTIVRIDAATGVVVTEIDAAGLLTPAEEVQANVLNGIAFDPASGHFFLTGKLWPKLFEVGFDFDPWGNDPCERAALVEVGGLRMDKDGASGIRFAWQGDPLAVEYHVNHVAALEHLPAPGLHRPDVPGGHGVPSCDAPHPGLSCVDADARSDPEPLLFYRVFSACGPTGEDEGPP